MKSATFVFIVLGVITVNLCGCRMTYQSPREAFLSHVPDRTNYFKCYEVSIESMQEHEDRIARLKISFARGVRQTITNCPPCPEIQERLSRIESVSDHVLKSHVELMAELRKEYDPKKDTILYFKYCAGDRQESESGLLVTRNGIVKKKFVDDYFQP
jgi:hypothetical protein